MQNGSRAAQARDRAPQGPAVEGGPGRVWFRDADELNAAARGWSFEFVQLDCGAFSGMLEQRAGRDVAVTHFRFNRFFQQLGVIEGPSRTFALFLDRITPFTWLDRDFAGDDLCLFPADGAFDCVSRPGFDAASVTVSASLLEAVADRHGLQRAYEAIPAHGAAIGGARQVVPELRASVRSFLGRPPEAMGLGELEQRIAQQVLLGFEAPSERMQIPSQRRRDRGFAAAMQLVHEGPAGPPAVLDLCTRIGVSERTLRYAFRERLGVSPKQYLKALALHRVRRELKHSPDVAVLDVAARNGFWHSGQFARDYRARFGELPSETARPR